MTINTHYIAIALSDDTAATGADRETALDNLHQLLCEPEDAYSGTVLVLQIDSPIALNLEHATISPHLFRLENYQPDWRAKRRDERAADIDELAMRHPSA